MIHYRIITMDSLVKKGDCMKLIGNEHIWRQIHISMKAAKELNKALPHMLFSGAAGCGKTSIAREIANITNTDFISIIPESLNKMDDIWDIMDRLDHTNYSSKGHSLGPHKPTVIFIDEIHNINSLKVQEWLGLAMENYRLPSDRNVGKEVWLPRFTLIGATTDDGKLSKPFRDRFKQRFIYSPYAFEESVEIVMVHAERLNIAIMKSAAGAIAKRGRGVPRILVGYLERARDMAYSLGIKVVMDEIVEETFRSMRIDNEGLAETEQKILKVLYDAKEPVGLDNLSIIVNEATKTILQSIEPFLIQKGLIIRSGRGRKITKDGMQYLEKGGYFGKEGKHTKEFVKEEIAVGYIRR